MLEGYDFVGGDFGQILECAKEKSEKARKNRIPVEVFERAQAGDDEAFEKIYLQYMPVAEYLYLRNKYKYQDAGYDDEVMTAYHVALVRMIRSYKPKNYQSPYQCLQVFANREVTLVLNRIKKREEREGLIVGNKIDDIPDVEEGNIAESYIGRIISLLSERDRDLIMMMSEARNVAELARKLGVKRQTLDFNYSNARMKCQRISGTCNRIAKAYYKDKKSIREIAKEMGIKMVEVGYHLRLDDYLHKGGKLPEPIAEPFSYERLRIAECVLNPKQLDKYRKVIKGYQGKLHKAPKLKIDKCAPVYTLVEVARERMFEVVERQDGKTRRSDKTGEEILFYKMLYNYVMLDQDKPTINSEIKSKIIEIRNSEMITLGVED